MKKFLLLFFLCFNFVSAADMQIRILSNLKISSVIVSPVSGNYILYADGKKINEPDHVYQLIVFGDSIKLKSAEKELGTFALLKFTTKGAGQAFKIKTIIPEGKTSGYEGDLEVTVANKLFKLVNTLDFENYLAGVVETESGTRSPAEYYKLQSILCRTYALAHLRRHEAEGFQLCDQEHCQAYKGRSVNSKILNAVLATKGIVIVDKDLNLIIAAFHSNCGGCTVNSEDVWTQPTSYLKAVKDTFCLRMPHAKWHRKIPAAEWKNYLEGKRRSMRKDSLPPGFSFGYAQDQRAVNFIDKDFVLPLKTIRADLKLRSTYFSIEQKNDSVIIRGKGYGHGVGLCQEGAMRMAALNYSYKDILHFYYRDVNLVDLKALDFFRQE
jgi:stage II sporulation protein D